MAPLHQGKQKDLQEVLCFPKEKKGFSMDLFGYQRNEIRYKHLKAEHGEPQQSYES